MNSEYLRLPQDASDLFYSRNEKEGNDHRAQWASRKNLILLLSAVFNAVLCISFILMLKEKPTPIGFGEHILALRMRVLTDWY